MKTTNPEQMTLEEFIEWYASEDIMEAPRSLGGILRRLTDAEKRARAVNFYNQVHNLN